MASGPTVTLTFAGDEKQLTKAFGKVESAAESMSSDVQSSSQEMTKGFGSATRSMRTSVDDSSKSMRSSSEGVSRWSDRADEADTKAMGFRDTITGVGDTFRGLSDSSLSTEERLLTLGMGVGDLASGFANLLIPAFGTFITFLRATAIPAVWSFTTALLSNPITWLVVGIAAVVAAIVLMITHWDWVKDVFTTVVNWIGDRLSWVGDLVAGVASWIGQRFADAWQWVQNLAGSVAGWISARWQAVSGFFGRIFNGIRNVASSVFGWIGDRISDVGRIASSIGSGISNAFKSAFNFVASIWNNTVGSLSFSIPSWVPGIGGNTLSMPKIPTFHTGGVVPGPPGSETLALLEAGETVLPTQGGAGGGGGGAGLAVSFRGNTDSAVATLIMRLIRSGDIQIQGVA